MTVMAEETENRELENLIIRVMRETDLAPVVEIDAVGSRRRRPEYFRLIYERTTTQGAMQISLVAEMDKRVVGFLIGSVYFGQFGILEPSASIEAIGVSPDVRRHRVAHALFRQLRSNLGAVGVTTLRTEVAWSDFDLLGFFKSEGFTPAPRLCLECTVNPWRNETASVE